MIPGITRAHLTMCLYNASNDIICIKHNKLSDNESLYAKVDFVRDINKGWKDVFLEKIKNNPDGIFNYAYLIEELQIADNYLLENDMIAAAMRIFARDAHYTLSKGSGCYRFYSKKEIPFSSIKTAVEFCNSSVDEIRRNPQAVLKKMRDKNVFVTKKQLDRVKMYGEDEV